jgi:purine-binding chemotaxis protein CheW
VTADQFILPFTVDGHPGAVALESVKEVVRATAVTRLPATPGIIEGIINLRGVIVPVVDLRRRFGLPPKEPHLTDRFVIADSGLGLLGLHVDTVDPVMQVDPEKLTAIRESSFAGQIALTGVVQTTDGILLIHDLADFFSCAERQAIDAALFERV